MVEQCCAHDSPGEAAEGGKNQRQQAGEIMACEYTFDFAETDCLFLFILHSKIISVAPHPQRNKNENCTHTWNTQTKCNLVDMKANNYEVAEAGETITFRGLVARSKSQAFFLTFCTAIGMASLALVLQIQLQDLGKRVLCNDISL
jgi:hypothetical protein